MAREQPWYLDRIDELEGMWKIAVARAEAAEREVTRLRGIETAALPFLAWSDEYAEVAALRRAVEAGK